MPTAIWTWIQCFYLKMQQKINGKKLNFLWNDPLLFLHTTLASVNIFSNWKISLPKSAFKTIGGLKMLSSLFETFVLVVTLSYPYPYSYNFIAVELHKNVKIVLYAKRHSFCPSSLIWILHVTKL